MLVEGRNIYTLKLCLPCWVLFYLRINMLESTSNRLDVDGDKKHVELDIVPTLVVMNWYAKNISDDKQSRLVVDGSKKHLEMESVSSLPMMLIFIILIFMRKTELYDEHRGIIVGGCKEHDKLELLYNCLRT